MVIIPICSNSNSTILRKRKTFLCVANLTTMHLNTKIERETTILLKLRSTWLKEQTSLLWLFQVNIVSNEKNWVVDSGATWHMCANKKLFSTYKPSNDREEVVYLRNSRIANVLRKCKVFLKLTSGKTLALNEMLYVSHIIANLVYVGLLRKFRIKV